MARFNCERCGESYNEDNLEICIRCERTVCPRCAGWVKQKDRSKKWMCDGCARAEGLTPQA